MTPVTSAISILDITFNFHFLPYTHREFICEMVDLEWGERRLLRTFLVYQHLIRIWYSRDDTKSGVSDKSVKYATNERHINVTVCNGPPHQLGWFGWVDEKKRIVPKKLNFSQSKVIIPQKNSLVCFFVTSTEHCYRKDFYRCYCSSTSISNTLVGQHTSKWIKSFPFIANTN